MTPSPAAFAAHAVVCALCAAACAAAAPHQPAAITLSPTRSHVSLPDVSVAPGESLSVRIAVPHADSAVMVELIHERALPLNRRPDPVLIFSENCTATTTADEDEHGVLYDLEAFVTMRPYAFVVARNIPKNSPRLIRVLNRAGTGVAMLNATLIVSLEVPKSADEIAYDTLLSSAFGYRTPLEYKQAAGRTLCPRGHSKFACSDRGVCDDGVCRCGASHQGRYCEHVVRDLPSGPIRIHPNEMKYFRYVAPRDGDVASVLQCLLPNRKMLSKHNSDRAELLTATAPILLVKRLGENGGFLLPEGPVLPTSYDEVFSDQASLATGSLTQTVLRRGISRGEVLYLGVLNTPLKRRAFVDASEFLRGQHEESEKQEPGSENVESMHRSAVQSDDFFPLRDYSHTENRDSGIQEVWLEVFECKSPAYVDQDIYGRGIGQARSPLYAAWNRFQAIVFANISVFESSNGETATPSGLPEKSMNQMMARRRLSGEESNKPPHKAQVGLQDYLTLPRSPFGYHLAVPQNMALLRDTALREKGKQSHFEKVHQEFDKGSDAAQLAWGVRRSVCPSPLLSSRWQTDASIILVPVVLGTLTMISTAMCMAAWARVFRVHILRALHGGLYGDMIVSEGDRMGFPEKVCRDFLTDSEIRAMFPELTYSQSHAPAIDASGDRTCSVCLGSYEIGDALRRLGCGHVYHAGCLDQWLRTSATCPRCRCPARIAAEAAPWWGGAQVALRAVAARVHAARQRVARVPSFARDLTAAALSVLHAPVAWQAANRGRRSTLDDDARAQCP